MAKQRLMTGQSNYVSCPLCGYEGRLATPIVYHDNEKELLLTFFPFELGLPVNEQEKMIGPLIKQATERLPLEKRKGYLLKPQANLTYESMIETILYKDGVTPEALKAQKERIALVERLIQEPKAATRSELIKQNENIIDEQFFTLFGRVAQSAVANGGGQMELALGVLQKQLLEETETGRQLQESVKEIEIATQILRDAGKNLTREKLLDFVLEADSEARIRAFVSLARGGMDYGFFQNLTEKIDKASGEEKTRLETVREKLLGFISEVDKQLEARFKQAQSFIESILAQEDVDRATRENIEGFPQIALDVANQLLQKASEQNDYARMGKLQKMTQVLKAVSAPPSPEIAFVESLIQAPDVESVEKLLADNDALITDQFVEALSGLVVQFEAQAKQGNPEAVALSEKLSEVYKIVLKHSMQKKQMG
jgi:hypothetical protein